MDNYSLSNTSATELARLLLSIEQRLDALERAPKMKNVSIDGGNLPIYDNNGQILVTVGPNPDGTPGIQYYNAVPPTRPAPALVSGTYGGLNVASYGLSADSTDWPADLERFDVHVSTASSFTPTLATYAGSMASTSGGILAVLGLVPGTQYWVSLVAVNTSGAQSLPSVPVDGVPISAVTHEDMDEYEQDMTDLEGSLNQAIGELADVANSKSEVFYNNPSGGDPFPTASQINDTWLRPDEDHAVYRWDGTNWTEALLGAHAIAESAITSTHLQDNAVITDKIAEWAIEADQLAPDSVVADKIAVGAVTSPALDDAAVTAAKIAGSAVTAGKIAPGAVTTTAIADFAVPVTKLVSKRHQLY